MNVDLTRAETEGPPGERAAKDFALPDQRGATFRLREQLASGRLLLVFYRGHWCPYCRRYLCKLQTRLADFAARGAAVVAISPEPPATSRALARELGLNYRLLSDVDGRVIDAFGVRNGFGSARVLMPHPAVLLLDGAGVVRHRSIDRNFRKRTTMRTILGWLDAAGAA